MCLVLYVAVAVTANAQLQMVGFNPRASSAESSMSSAEQCNQQKYTVTRAVTVVTLEVCQLKRHCRLNVTNLTITKILV